MRLGGTLYEHPPLYYNTFTEPIPSPYFPHKNKKPKYKAAIPDAITSKTGYRYEKSDFNSTVNYIMQIYQISCFPAMNVPIKYWQDEELKLDIAL